MTHMDKSNIELGRPKILSFPISAWYWLISVELLDSHVLAAIDW